MKKLLFNRNKFHFASFSYPLVSSMVSSALGIQAFFIIYPHLKKRNFSILKRILIIMSVYILIIAAVIFISSFVASETLLISVISWLLSFDACRAINSYLKKRNFSVLKKALVMTPVCFLVIAAVMTVSHFFPFSNLSIFSTL